MSTWNSINMMDANSSNMEQLNYFHDYTMMISMMITILIMYSIITLKINSFNNKLIIQNQPIEIIWTITPMIILIFLAIPSLKILYLTEEILSPIFTIKVIGHQWYWSYEYSDFNSIEFDSFMLNYNNKSNNNQFRLLDVDNRMIVPTNNSIRILVSSNDVIHSWTVPSLAIKIDAIPGRINQTSLISNFPSIMFGQCSEICGMNHSFMPIVIESTSNFNFMNWLMNY